MTRIRRIRRFGLALAATLTVLVVAACAPGGSGPTEGSSVDPSDISTDPSQAGKVTLTVWDAETDDGISKTVDQLNKQFEEKYPNVTIKRTTRSLADMKTTLKLAMSGENPPDVVEANQGYSDMAAYVKAGLLTDLDPYADVYGWKDRFPASQLALNSVPEDGSKLGSGNLYGVSFTGEIVGVYYNKKVLDQLGLQVAGSQQDLADQLGKIKSEGTTPIAFGNSNKSSAIHLFGDVIAPLMGAEQASKLVFEGEGWDDPAVKQAAQTISDWAQQGYFTDGYAGQNLDTAVEQFEEGQSPYLITGTWYQSTLSSNSDIGFTVLPEEDGGEQAALGGVGFPWAVPARAEHQDVAAAYIDFISSADGMAALEDNSQLPAVPTDRDVSDAQLNNDIRNTWTDINDAEGLVPYLDWTTTTFYDTLTQQLQLLLGGEITADQFVAALQKDIDAFQDENDG